MSHFINFFLFAYFCCLFLGGAQGIFSTVWCPWGPWSACSVTCGNGYRAQDRACICKKLDIISAFIRRQSCEHLSRERKTDKCSLAPCPLVTTESGTPATANSTTFITMWDAGILVLYGFGILLFMLVIVPCFMRWCRQRAIQHQRQRNRLAFTSRWTGDTSTQSPLQIYWPPAGTLPAYSTEPSILYTPSNLPLDGNMDWMPPPYQACCDNNLPNNNCEPTTSGDPPPYEECIKIDKKVVLTNK